MYIILVYNCVFDYITDCKFNKTCKYAGLVLNFEFLKSLCKYLEFGICFLFVCFSLPQGSEFGGILEYRNPGKHQF